MHILTQVSDEQNMCRLAQRLADLLRKGDCLTFHGDLGAGKTTFIRAIIQKIAQVETVPSPTFTLVQTYDSAIGSLWHFDLYRIKQPQELYELGLDEALSDGIVFIEWPSRAKDLLPAHQLQLHFENAQDMHARKITLSGEAQWASRLTSLTTH